MSWINRLGNLLRPAKLEQELDEEIQFHIDARRQDNLAQGMPEAEARWDAQRRFGNRTLLQEQTREANVYGLLQSVSQDLRYACRGFRQNPGFALTAIAALAVGIGSTTAVFSVANAILLKALPVPDPDRVVVLMTTNVSEGGESSNDDTSSPAKFIHWREQTSVLQEVSAYLGGTMNYTGDVMEQWHSMQATQDVFRCFGMPILQGRDFSEEEELPNGPRAAIISQGLWKRRFAAAAQVIGRKISLGGELYTVVGVVGDSPGLMEIVGPPTDVFVPFQIDPNSRDRGETFTVVARLKPAITLQQAKERLQASAADYRAKIPNDLGKTSSFTAVPLREAIVSDVGPLLVVLGGAVTLVLLIACANVANLLLARAASRAREIGIRVAIGAGRGRVIRQVLTESILLALIGGAAGLLLGEGGIRVLLAANEIELPPWFPVGIDWRVMTFTVAVSFATSMAFGLIPAFHGSRVDLNSVLKDSSGHTGTGRRQNQIQSLLVISEVSLVVVLLVGSALLIRTFVALYRVDRGFETKNILILQASLIGPRYAKASGVGESVRDSLTRISALPGVVSAGAASYLPLQGNLNAWFDIPGRAPGKDPHLGGGGWTPVSPGYFETFKIPLKRGRLFTDHDDSRSTPVAVINEALVKVYWKDGDPLTDRIVIGQGIGREFNGEPPRQIIGVVGDTRQESLQTSPGPRMYVPSAQLPDSTNSWIVRLAPMSWAVRTQAESHALEVAIQEQLRQALGLPISNVHTMDGVLISARTQQRFTMLVMTVFACSALLLAAIGIYGVMAYPVEQRKQEIGIRLALGAEASRVKGMVVFQGVRLAIVGVSIGLAAAWGLARFMESFLFQVKPRDPIVFVTVPVALALVAFLAVWFPAKRASCVDPVVALRYE